MNKTTFKTSALLALAGMALLTPIAKATVTYADGDLLLGIRDSSGTSTNTVLIDLGSAGFFRDQTTNITLGGTNNLGNIGADLTTAFGAGWQTNTSLQWGIVGKVSGNLGVTFGGTNDPKFTLYASLAESTFGTAGTAYSRAASGTQGTPAGAIQAVAGEFNSNDIGWTAGANPDVIIEPTSGNTQNWAANNPGTNSFNYFTGLQGSFAGDSSGGGLAKSALDLFRMTPGSGLGSYEGSFTISSSGTVSYTSSPPSITTVPEPGRAVLLVVGLASLVMRRRRPSIA